MTKMTKLVSNAIILSMMFVGSTTFAEDITGDTVPTDLTVEKRIYQHDGFGAQWALDVGSDGLWFVNKEPIEGVYNAALKIDNNASANALVVGSSIEGKEGFVGIGTDVPDAQVDVKWAGDNAVGDGLTGMMVLTALNTNTDLTSDAGFVLRNGRTGKQWNFRTTDDGDGFAATQNGTGGTEFRVVNTTGNVSGARLYLGNGAKCENGVWINRSSRASKENIVELSSSDALKAFNDLKAVTYNYKTDKKEQYVGFIAEDVPELVAINSRDGLSAMDMVAVLTKVVQDQAVKIEKLEKMQKRLVRVESLLTNLALETSTKEANKITLK